MEGDGDRGPCQPNWDTGPESDWTLGQDREGALLALPAEGRVVLMADQSRPPGTGDELTRPRNETTPGTAPSAMVTTCVSSRKPRVLPRDSSGPSAARSAAEWGRWDRRGNRRSSGTRRPLWGGPDAPAPGLYKCHSDWWTAGSWNECRAGARSSPKARLFPLPRSR